MFQSRARCRGGGVVERGNGGGGVDLQIPDGAAGRIRSGAGITLDAVTGGGNQIFILIQFKTAVAGDKAHATRRILNDEEAVALNGKVGFNTGGIQCALSKFRINGGAADAAANLHRAARAGVAEGLAERVGKLHGGRFVAGGVDVRDVVADDLEVILKLLESADAGLK